VFPLGCGSGAIFPGVDGRLLRHRLGYTDDDVAILCNRKHEEVYGAEYLVRAIPLVLSKLPKARFLMIGEGTQTSKLRLLASQLDVARFVSFLGTVANELMPRYVSAADVYISPSLSDGTSS